VLAKLSHALKQGAGNPIPSQECWEPAVQHLGQGRKASCPTEKNIKPGHAGPCPPGSWQSWALSELKGGPSRSKMAEKRAEKG